MKRIEECILKEGGSRIEETDGGEENGRKLRDTVKNFACRLVDVDTLRTERKEFAFSLEIARGRERREIER